jgi:hypothetical protein
MNTWRTQFPHIDHIIDDEMYRLTQRKDDGDIAINQLAKLGC